MDGIIIRGSGAYNPEPPENLPLNDQALKLEPAVIAAQWNDETAASSKSIWGKSWAKWFHGPAQIQRRRQLLRYVVDAFIVEGHTLAVIKNIDQIQQSGQGSIEGWPCTKPDSQVFCAGTPKFRQVLGTPAGIWVSELLLSYQNPSADRLGPKVISSVTVWLPTPQSDLPALIWRIEDHTPDLVQTISQAMMDEPLPEHGQAPRPQFDSGSGNPPPPGYDEQMHHSDNNGRA